LFGRSKNRVVAAFATPLATMVLNF
jgi:hypothetical protein